MEEKLNETLTEESLQLLDSIYEKNRDRDSVMIYLQKIQSEMGYVPQYAIEYLAKKTKASESHMFGVVTFYSQFHQKPRGKNIVTVCCGTVCHVKGAPRIISKVQDDLKLKEGQDTTKDMNFTLERVNCVGACSIAPVVLINEKVLGKVTPSKMVKSLKAYKD